MSWLASSKTKSESQYSGDDVICHFGQRAVVEVIFIQYLIAAVQPVVLLTDQREIYRERVELRTNTPAELLGALVKASRVGIGIPIICIPSSHSQDIKPGFTTDAIVDGAGIDRFDSLIVRSFLEIVGIQPSSTVVHPVYVSRDKAVF